MSELLRWECFDCGNTTSEADAKKADKRLAELYGSSPLPVRTAQCPKCKSENVKRYDNA